jgi:hypothetical protein
MSEPVPLGYAESGNYTEREKDPTQNKMIRDPGDACAEERQGGEQSKVPRLGVHSRSRLERGSDQAAPCARVDGLEPLIRAPAAERQAIFLVATEPRAARPGKPPPRSDASRPRPVGGVNELVKYADIDVR